MKRLGRILSIAVMMALLASSVFAQEMMEKTGKEEDIQFRMMRGRGVMGMGHTPMMRRGRMMGRRGRMPIRGRGRMMGRMGMMADLAEKLDLSEEQRNEINDIFTAHKKDMIRKNADREIAGVELHGLMQQEKPDLAAIKDQIRDIANLEADMKYSQIKVWIDARTVLTEEQRTALKKMLKDKRPQMMRGKRGRHGTPGPKRGSVRHRR